jgi:hypothetical protein
VDTIWIGADKRITFSGIKKVADDGTESYANAATVTYALKDAAGATVAGGTGSLAHLPTSNGNYAGVIDRAVTALCKRDREYKVEVTFSEAGFDDFRVLDCVALYRGAT